MLIKKDVKKCIGGDCGEPQLLCSNKWQPWYRPVNPMQTFCLFAVSYDILYMQPAQLNSEYLLLFQIHLFLLSNITINLHHCLWLSLVEQEQASIMHQGSKCVPETMHILARAPLHCAGATLFLKKGWYHFGSLIILPVIKCVCSAFIY